MPTHNCMKCGRDFNKAELQKVLKGYTEKCPFCNAGPHFHYEYKKEVLV